MRNLIILITILFIFSSKIKAQSPYFLNFNSENKTIERLDIKGKFDNSLHTSIKYQPINEITDNLTFSLDSIGDISDKDIENIDFILNDNKEWIFENDIEYYKSHFEKNTKNGFLNTFYKNNSSFFTIHSDDFFMKINPVIYFNYGNDINNSSTIFQNTRGFQISGLVGKKIYYYTSLLETQQSFLKHIQNKINRDLAVPGQGLYKSYNSSVIENLTGYDFLNGQAYIGFNLIKQINAEIGHGKFFIGNGIRSLLLSDYGQNYFYLKFDTKVWKLHYQNIFAELTAQSHVQTQGDVIIPKKYMASHYLSFQPNSKFEIGLYESVIFNRENGFELQYLNPVIVYRTVEHFIGSPDNVLVGLNWKYNFLNRFSIYGQLLLDEFNFGIIKDNATWWGNKYGIQAGLKYIDVFGIDQLDAQFEVNRIRPYTYSHGDSISNYSNFNQALAHPLGANLDEFIFSLTYHPFKNLFLNLNAIKSIYGDDPINDNVSYGGNILKSYNLRPKDDNGNLIDYGYKVGGGIKTNISQYKFNLTYMVFHNYFIDFDIIYRNENSEIDSRDFSELYLGGGLRVNICRNNLDY